VAVLPESMHSMKNVSDIVDDIFEKYILKEEIDWHDFQVTIQTTDRDT
jgi:hypothetical protein